LPDQSVEGILLYEFYKKDNNTGSSNYQGISLLSTSYKIFSNILSRLSPYILMKLLGIISVGFDITDELLIRYFAFIKYWRKNENTIHRLQEGP
jgi:hypothetical protein